MILEDDSRPEPLPAWIPLVFFVSGFAALLYQVVWQRALYAIFGVNIESVTIVVTAFLVGLGVGSLVGGAVSKRPDARTILLFGLVELCIAAFGISSLQIFRWTGAATLYLSSFARAAATFAVVLIPTVLMGATLPLLVAHMVRISKNVGESVSLLYFVNTAGSALAAYAAVLLLLRTLGESRTVALAAAMNATVGAVTLGYYLLSSRRAGYAS